MSYRSIWITYYDDRFLRSLTQFFYGFLHMWISLNLNVFVMLLLLLFQLFTTEFFSRKLSPLKPNYGVGLEHKRINPCNDNNKTEGSPKTKTWFFSYFCFFDEFEFWNLSKISHQFLINFKNAKGVNLKVWILTLKMKTNTITNFILLNNLKMLYF